MSVALASNRLRKSLTPDKLHGSTVHTPLDLDTCRCITVKILKFGTPQTMAIIVLKIEKFDVTLH